ncbi:MAG: 3-hydroxyisobutyrate dehydrogenase [Vulcanimicrobiaceae bacterium]
MSDLRNVAFLGLGAMGLPMAENLLRAGFALTVWNRTPSRADGIVERGARRAASPADAAAGADVVLLCVPSSGDVRSLLERPDGIFAGARTGTTIVDCSTIDPNASREFHEAATARGLRFLEAPLSGGTVGAKNATLTLMVGGDGAVLERVRPVLSAVGRNLFHLGGPGAGQTTKLCNQMIFAAQMVAVAEAYTLLADGGIDPVLATDVFRASTADCVAVRGRVPVSGVQPEAPASNGWQPGFATEWMAKDLALVEALARTTMRPVFQAAVNHQLMRLTMRAGYRGLDVSAVGEVLLRLGPDGESERSA